MTSALRRLPAAAFLVLATLLAACSGSPSPSPNVVDPLTITVQPSSLVIYPGVPATLLITGGTGSYVVASNNQAIVPITVAGVGHQLTVIANPVSADTAVALSIRDTGTTPATTANLTVRPGTIANSISVTPVATDCNVTSGTTTAVFLCSGGEALVTATISQAGNILPARGARFDVVSGDVRFIVTPPGVSPEVTALTTTAVSDQNGVVRVRLRAVAGAPPQNALIQVTDPETGAFQRVVVPIRQPVGPGGAAFFALPESITFTGPFIGQCANSPTSDFVIFGGSPPYTVVSTSPAVLTVIPAMVPASGGSFTVRVQGAACMTDIPITITDAAGRTISVRVTNQPGTQAAPPANVTVAPSTATLCRGGTVSFVVNGGTPPFSAGVNHPAIMVTVTDRTITTTRASMPVLPASARLNVTDGASVGFADLNTPDNGVGGC